MPLICGEAASAARGKIGEGVLGSGDAVLVAALVAVRDGRGEIWRCVLGLAATLRVVRLKVRELLHPFREWAATACFVLEKLVLCRGHVMSSRQFGA